MNKTLLIIICDFLLISILALVEFKPGIEEQLVDEQSLRDESAEEMLELLQLFLYFVDALLSVSFQSRGRLGHGQCLLSFVLLRSWNHVVLVILQMFQISQLMIHRFE